MGIVVAFAGTGKTTFCEKTNAIDFISMPFKYINFYELSESLRENEIIKASEELICCPNWQKYYYAALKETYKTYPEQLIIIPTIGEIMEWLEADDIPYVLVYPERTAKHEYEQRFRARGNSEDFLSVFIDSWDYWMEGIRSHAKAEQIELKENEYLSDFIKAPVYDDENIIKDGPAYIKRLRENALKQMYQETDLFKHEKICGKDYYIPASEGFSYSMIVGNLFFLLRTQIKNREGFDMMMFCGNYPLYVSEDCLVIPDIMMINDRELSEEDHYRGVPCFIVEVTSALTEVRDRGIKKEVYENLGVKEYWIVSPQEQSIDIYYLESGKYVLKRRMALREEDNDTGCNDKMNLQLREFPEIQIDFRWIFD